jgi:succinoglycan biosynthesis protein ExoM
VDPALGRSAGMNPKGPIGPERVMVCIPTCRRPRMLQRTLSSIEGAVVPEGVELSILVVDNDAAASARPGVQDFHGRLPVHYEVEVERGLSTVRNRLLDEARQRQATWVAFIDDDEVVTPEWLLHLWSACQRYSARLAAGPVYRVPWEEVQGAVAGQELPPDRPQRATGSRPRKVAAGNVLLALDSLGDPPQRFDAALNFSGGEDHEFFGRLQRLDVPMVWVQEAVVLEWHPPERQTLGYLLRRHYTDGVSAVARDLRLGSPWKVVPRYLLKAAGKLVGALLTFLLAPFSRSGERSPGLVKLCSAAGYAAGLLGFRAERYRHTDGF